MDKPISVVIVDDHQVVLDGFMARLELEPDIDVIGTASNGLEAIEVSKVLNPDVILMDISMPIMNGIEATGVIKEERPESKILMLTMHDNREYIMKVMQAGAVGYMLKEISADKMVQAIKTVNQGSTYFCESVTQTLFTQDDVLAIVVHSQHQNFTFRAFFLNHACRLYPIHDWHADIH